MKAKNIAMIAVGGIKDVNDNTGDMNALTVEKHPRMPTIIPIVTVIPSPMNNLIPVAEQSSASQTSPDLGLGVVIFLKPSYI